MRETRARKREGVKWYEAKPAMDVDDFRRLLARKAQADAENEALQRAEEAEAAAELAAQAEHEAWPAAEHELTNGAAPMETGGDDAAAEDATAAAGRASAAALAASAAHKHQEADALESTEKALREKQEAKRQRHEVRERLRQLKVQEHEQRREQRNTGRLQQHAAAEADRLERLAEAEAKQAALSAKAAEHAVAAAEAEAKLAKLNAIKHELVLQLKQVLQREEAERSSHPDNGRAPDPTDQSPANPAEAPAADRPTFNGAFLPPAPLRGGQR